MQLRRIAWLAVLILLVVRGPEPEDPLEHDEHGDAHEEPEEEEHESDVYYPEEADPEPEVAPPIEWTPLGGGPPEEEPDDPVEEDLSSDQVHKIFNKIDDDLDGKLSIEELMEFGQRTRRDIAHRFSKMLLRDTDVNENNDGKISFEEFSRNMGRLADFGYAEDYAREDTAHTEKFKAADRDSNGGLDRSELPAMLNPVLDDDVLLAHAKLKLQTLDENGDGQLTEDEFEREAEQFYGDAKPDQDDEIRLRNSAVFDKLDENHDGVINSAEMMQWASGFFSMDEAMKHLIEVADKNKDKKITLEELDGSRSKLWGTSTSSHIGAWCDHYEL